MTEEQYLLHRLGMSVPDRLRLSAIWRALRDAYAASRHEPTLLTIDNLDAFAKAVWAEWQPS